MLKTYITTLFIAISTFPLFAKGIENTPEDTKNIYLNASGFARETVNKYLVACGSDKIKIIDVEKSTSEKSYIKWEWTLEDTKEQVPSNYVNYFIKMDECKPFDNNTKIMACSSSNGSMVIDIATKKCLFVACTPMAHSIEMLPGNRLVVAESTHDKGNALEVFAMDQKVGSLLYRTDLTSAHGVLWDDKTQRLYAIGGNLLRVYKLTEWETVTPSITCEKEYTLPVSDAHDLTRYTQDTLIVSCTSGVYQFRISNGSIKKFAPLENYTNLKSVNANAETKQIIYTEPEESWWTFHIKSIHPTWTLPVPDINMYKVRVFE